MDWQPIETAPAHTYDSFLIAAHTDHPERGLIQIVGEAERDPDDPDLFWWVSQRGEHYADHIAAGGWTITHWRPLPAPPTPASPEKKE